MKTNARSLLALAALTTFSAEAQTLNSGAFAGLPEASDSSLGVWNLNLVRRFDEMGPTLNWWLDGGTPGHSLIFDVDSPTGYFQSHFYTSNALWSWTTVNSASPIAMQLTEAGRLTLFNQYVPSIVLDPSTNGAAAVTIQGVLSASSLQVSGPVNFPAGLTLGSALSVANGGTGLDGSAVPADRFLYTTATGTFGEAAVTGFGRSLLDDSSAAAARATLGAAAATDIPMFWKFAVEQENGNFGSLSSPASVGSGVTYWPSRDTFLLLDNTTGAARVLEYSKAGVLQRTIALSSFGDPEDIHWISGNSFAISQERNTGSVDEIVVIDLPTTGTSVNISSATRRLQINTASFTSASNLGIEGFALVGSQFYFTTEKPPSTPSAEWNVWRIPNTGSGTVSVTPTRAFRLQGLLAGRATDISGMATDGSCLWLLSHEGANANGPGRVLKTTLDGRLIEENTLPAFGDGGFWRQAEGIELFTDNDGKVKFAIVGEVGSGGSGVDFMLLSLP
jgi:uncharacterized protein YjiK